MTTSGVLDLNNPKPYIGAQHVPGMARLMQGGAQAMQTLDPTRDTSFGLVYHGPELPDFTAQKGPRGLGLMLCAWSGVYAVIQEGAADPGWTQNPGHTDQEPGVVSLDEKPNEVVIGVAGFDELNDAFARLAADWLQGMRPQL